MLGRGSSDHEAIIRFPAGDGTRISPQLSPRGSNYKGFRLLNGYMQVGNLPRRPSFVSLPFELRMAAPRPSRQLPVIRASNAVKCRWESCLGHQFLWKENPSRMGTVSKTDGSGNRVGGRTFSFRHGRSTKWDLALFAKQLDRQKSVERQDLGLPPISGSAGVESDASHS